MQSRYYDPNIGRFINADEPEILISIHKSLYTYCNNCPMKFIDPEGYWYYSLNTYYEDAVLYWRNRIGLYARNMYNNYSSIYNRAKSQYDYNKKSLGSYANYIRDQNNSKFKNLKYGSSTIGSAGCEIIALYNTLKFFNRWHHLYSLIAVFYINGLLWADGLLGVWPPNLKIAFNAYTLKYSYYTNKNKFFEATKKSKFNVVSYWTGIPYLSPLHTIAFYYNKKGGYYSYYNNGSDRIGSASKTNDIKRKGFICGYTF